MADYKALNAPAQPGQPLLVVFSIIGIGLLIAGCILQEWEYFNCQDVLTMNLGQFQEGTTYCPSTTGGKYDKTKFCWITDFVLAAMFFLMAVVAPGDGDARIGFTVAFIIMGLTWLQGGISHLRLDENNGADPNQKLQDFLWYSALWCGPVGNIVLLMTMLVVAGWCTGCCAVATSTTLSAAFGAILYLAESGKLKDRKIDVETWLIVAGVTLGCILLQVLTAILSKLRTSVLEIIMYSVAVAATFAANQFKPKPFPFDDLFNDNALFHTLYIFLGVTLFSLCREMVMPAAAPSGDGAREAALTTHMAPEEADKPQSFWCACCTRQGRGGTLVSNMEP